MSSSLVLSLFPGIGMLDAAFEAEGYTVVRGPDPLWGGDVRRFRAPPGRFDGIIGGDPCQSHSSLANLVRAKGLEPSFPDLSGEYQRVVEEAKPLWFLRENVPGAPHVWPKGYGLHTFLLDNAALGPVNGEGQEQTRLRRWWFGWSDGPAPDLRRWIDFALYVIPEDELAAPVTGRHEDAVGAPGRDYSPPRRSLEEMLRLQGFPSDWIGHQPWTSSAMRKMIGNGVPMPMGRALAAAVRKAVERRGTW